MKILTTFLCLLSVQLFSQTFLNVAYSDGTPINSTNVSSLRKITFSGSGMNFLLNDNTTIVRDLSIINRMTFGSTDLGNPLPVELVAFTADSKGRSVSLKWTTATEVNSLRFEVQRTSVSGSANRNWMTIGTINANVNSNSAKYYSFTDKNQEAGKYNYRLKIVDKDGSFKLTDVINAEVGLPDKFELMQNYPNPFNPSTVISYSLPFDCNVKMSLYDAVGRLVKDVINENQKAGYHDFNFNAHNLSSGVYFYSVSANSASGQNFHSVKKLALIK